MDFEEGLEDGKNKDGLDKDEIATMNAEKWIKANNEDWTYTGEWKQEDQEEGKKISFFKVQKNTKMVETRKSKSDGLPISAPNKPEEKKTDAAATKPVIEPEKNGPKDE